LFEILVVALNTPAQFRASARQCRLARARNLAVPDGIRLVFQPAHSPELQPAEHLWAFVNEPLASRCFAAIESLDQAVGDRCIALTQQTEIICDGALFHRWPRPRART
jgi:transposase